MPNNKQGEMQVMHKHWLQANKIHLTGSGKMIDDWASITRHLHKMDAKTENARKGDCQPIYSVLQFTTIRQNK